MDHETNYQTNHQFRRLPKGERRVRFADTMGMELVSIFLFDLINNYYFASIHNHHSIQNHISKHDHHHHHHNSHQHQDHNFNQQQKQQQHQQYRQQLQQQQLQQQQQKQLQQQQQHQHQLQLQQQQHYKQQNTNTNTNSSSNNNNNTTSTNSTNSSSANQTATFICEFTQPISLVSFKERVKLNKVHLETCSVNSRAGHTSVSCIIRVLNLSYDKSVIVRYTTDEWHTHTDSMASYKPGSCDGWSDKFTSTFSVTNQVKQFQAGQRIMFAIRITYDGDKIHWDNNGGLNYTVKMQL